MSMAENKELEIFYLQELASKYINVYRINEKNDILLYTSTYFTVTTIATKPVLTQIFLSSILTSYRNY